MFYRRAGILHTRYQDERQLWPFAFDRGLVATVLAILLVAPFAFDRIYLVTYLLPWIIWSSAALGLNLLMGGAGQVHLGYGAVMGIGAYASVHLLRAGIPLELALLAGGLASAAIGSLFGAAALRVKGLYLAMATLAMQYIVDFIISHFSIISGGSQATLQVPPVRFLGVSLASDAAAYYFALLICVGIVLFMLNVRRTSFGRALAAVREKDYAAAVIGVDSFRFKLVAFFVSSFVGGMVGCVMAVSYYRAVSPDQFHLDLSIQLVAMVIVGGLGSVLGSFFGAALILFAPIVLNHAVAFGADTFGVGISADLRAHLPLMLYGAMIVGFLLWEPLGLAKIYNNARNYFMVWPLRHNR
ncbi:branched-chain amino acid ABC transporter permease [Azorhizobium oxalatiphilum]|uniref:Branched-chain amino acid ABC transporter permease n=1 Tax=Azorhizobium oxalatiphilum TaxID=980631 RepID=A0A917BN68_9HYPH|nr:branched-chain amino acid ABC transporter permease [Azorhizobium oxalatiphilum]GGF52522.1 branched-chain amino acid ABC transporter permease [Azorhizobium oxalatiphilum]